VAFAGMFQSRLQAKLKTTAADSDGVTTNSECGVGVSAEFGGDAKAHAVGS